MPFPQSLDPGSNLPPGTFVPSAKHASNGLVEVREAIFTPDNSLYVADRAADCVRIYDASTGHFLRNLVSASDQVDRPIHLLLSPDGRYLFIGSGGTDSVLRHDLRRNSTSVFVTPKSGGLNGPPRVWHSATTVSSTLPVVIQRRSFVTMPRTVDHPATHSSRTWQTIPSF